MRDFVVVGSNFLTRKDNVSTVSYQKVDKVWRFVVNTKNEDGKLIPLWVTEFKTGDEAKELYNAILEQLK